MIHLKCFLSFVFVIGFCFSAFAQSNSSNRSIAIQQIRDLKTGALVVRLKTNDRSIESYRKAGQTALAEKLSEERKKQNQKLADAFRTYFDYCKVYFIYARNTDNLLKGKQNIFLNDTLEVDTSIHLTEKYFLIAEYGLITSNMRTDEYHYKSVNQTEATSSASSTSVVFISDTTLTQLKEPFPFYQSVYLDNYTRGVERMNNALHRAFYKLDDSAKEERKRLREQLRKLR